MSLLRRHRTPAAAAAPVWEPVRPYPEWLPDDGLVITDPQRVGPGLWRTIYLCRANRCAWITVCGYAVLDGPAPAGYRTRAAIRYTRTDVPGWACWTTHDLPTGFTQNPGYLHALFGAQDLARRVAESAPACFPQVFTWDTDPGSLYTGEMP